MEGKTDPEYGKCVALCTKGALHEMVAPALLAIIVPIITGLILGPTGVVGLLGGVSVTGFAMAVFMSNAGGAWDLSLIHIWPTWTPSSGERWRCWAFACRRETLWWGFLCPTFSVGPAVCRSSSPPRSGRER